MTVSKSTQSYTPDATLIAAHNDLFRQSRCLATPADMILPGVVVMTQSLAACAPEFIEHARIAIGEIDEFDPDNDPDGFHDFGSVEVDGQAVWFKIDMFEAGTGKMSGAETPDVAERTERVMTLMFPSDW
jgi:hypothetical protein